VFTLTTEALDQQANEQAAQAEWDAIAKERETGVPAAEKPQAEPEPVPVPAAPAVDPVQELREKFEKLEARTRNAEGHIGGLNHNQKLLQESLQAASRAATQQVSSAPTQAQVAEAMQDPAEWAALKAGYPEWATATEKFLDARLSRVRGAAVDPNTIARIVKEQVAGQTAAVRNEIIHTSLDAVFPGWGDEVKTDAFGKWLDAQPDKVRAMAMSSSVKDAATMLRLYEQAKANNPAADITAARNKKLANAASTPKGVKVPAAKSVDDMTKEELWNLEAQRRDRARQRT
jgi:hypothetical protein